MKNSVLSLIYLFPLMAFSMPSEIQNYNYKTIQTANASWFKDIISPTKDIHKTAKDIYDREIDDIKVNINIEKFRILQSKNINFLIQKKIETTNVLLDMSYINDTSNNKIDVLEHELKIK